MKYSIPLSLMAFRLTAAGSTGARSGTGHDGMRLRIYILYTNLSLIFEQMDRFLAAHKLNSTAARTIPRENSTITRYLKSDMIRTAVSRASTHTHQTRPRATLEVFVLILAAIALS